MMQQWFKDAKLGIFMHWGLYSVNGIMESWSFYRDHISYEDYMGQAKRFTASKYNPEKWADIFKKAGARYSVLTTKHHDGFALWDTAQSDLNVVKKTPAARDLIGPYCQAMRDAGIKVGLYFSHLDWSHPDNTAVVHPNASVYNLPFNKYTHHNGVDDPIRWQNFLRFHRAQLKELMTKYGTVDLLWFDGDWEKDAKQWDMKGLREYLHSFNPNVIINDRMQGYGDYFTPEQGFPISNPKADAWEYGITMNDSWGYQVQDHNHKPVGRLVRLFSEIIGRGGNMLLAIGPHEDGSLQPEQEKRLLEFGEWISPVSEAVYGTQKGLDSRYFMGASTLSKDRRTLYLFAFDRPKELFVKGIKNRVGRASVLKSGRPLQVDTMLGAEWNGVPPTLWIPVPEEELNPYATVVKLELEGELDLFEGAGGAIASN